MVRSSKNLFGTRSGPEGLLPFPSSLVSRRFPWRILQRLLTSCTGTSLDEGTLFATGAWNVTYARSSSALSCRLRLLPIATTAPTKNPLTICAIASSPGRPSRKSHPSSRSTPTTPHRARPSAPATRTSSRRCTSGSRHSKATSCFSRHGARSSLCGRTSSPRGRTVRIGSRFPDC